MRLNLSPERLAESDDIVVWLRLHEVFFCSPSTPDPQSVKEVETLAVPALLPGTCRLASEIDGAREDALETLDESAIVWFHPSASQTPPESRPPTGTAPFDSSGVLPELATQSGMSRSCPNGNPYSECPMTSSLNRPFRQVCWSVSAGGRRIGRPQRTNGRELNASC